MKGIVYLIVNSVNQKKYVGMTKCGMERRLRQHWVVSQKRQTTILSKALAKYGLDAFSISVLEEVELCDLREREKFYIKQLKPEYNMTCGGEGQLARIWINNGDVNKRILASDPIPEGFFVGQTKAMVAARANGSVGKKKSEASKQKMSASALKCWETRQPQHFSDEVRYKMSLAGKKPKSEETKKRMREAALRRWARSD